MGRLHHRAGESEQRESGERDVGACEAEYDCLAERRAGDDAFVTPEVI